MPFNVDSVEYYRGCKGEDIVAHILRNEGYYVNVLADIKDRNFPGAPGARNDKDFITLPDLDAAKNGKRGFVEVKYKAKPDYTKMTARDEHGIGLLHFRMYQKICNQFGSPVFLFIYEGNSGSVRYQNVNLLLPSEDYFTLKPERHLKLLYGDSLKSFIKARIYKGPSRKGVNKGGMIYFPRDSFKEWGIVAKAGDNIYEQLPLDLIEVDSTAKDLFRVTRSSAIL